MMESTISGLLATLPTPGNYFSLVKLTVMLLFLIPWWMLLPWLSKDVKYIRGNHLVWCLGLMGAGALGLLIWLLVPYFLAGLATYLVCTGAVAASYVVYRNGKVEPAYRVLTAEHIKGLLSGKKPDKDLTGRQVHIKVYTADNHLVPPPATTEDVATYNVAQDLLYAILYNRASEADLTPTGQQTRVRFVVDGVVRDQVPLALADSEAVVQYFKGVGGCDVNERRRPQTGKMMADMAGAAIDMELTTTGTTAGQRLRFRILREAIQLDLTALGMSEQVLGRVTALSQEPGIIIVSGRHDSGLTSTLYSLLCSHDAYMKQVMTVEAKMLADLENVTQNLYAQDSQRPGLLSAGLRRDPDIIMVDECTDAETANLILASAGQKRMILGASATESLVALAKWVAVCNSAGADAAAAVANLRAVLCQVLVRKLCTQCREAYRPNADLLAKLNLPTEVDRFYRPPTRPALDKKGNPIICQACQGTGYVGRTGVFELLEVTDELRRLIAAGGSLAQLKAACRKSGMLYLQEQALQKVIEGVSDLKEIVRVTQKESREQPQ